MQLLACWVILPLVAVLLSAGVGALVEAAAGRPLPGALHLPVGLAGVIALVQLTTTWGATARATLPVVLVAALAGLVLARRRLRASRPDPWAALAGLGVFAVAAAPVVLSGHPTFAGYTVLGDTSIHLIGADALLRHGRDFSALPPSSYTAALANYYGGAGYPSGGPGLVGTLSRLIGQDPAWAFQPVLAVLEGGLALALYALLTPAVPSRPWRGIIALLAGQPALVISYALQGSIKEIATVYAVTTVAALIAPWVLDREAGPRATIPLAVAAAAAVAVVGPAAGVWLAPLLVVALAARLRTRGRGAWRPLAGAVAVFAVVGLVLTWQSVRSLTHYVDVAGTVVTSQAESGNLLGPLRASQMFGIWLNGDYRLPPTSMLDDTYALIGVAALGALLGVGWLIRRRALAVGLYVVVSLLAWGYVTERGSPWADGKALMIVSPAVVLVALLGCRSLVESGRRIEGAVAVALIGLGVLASNALAYHDVSLAPYGRLTELARVGDRLKGTGPTLYPEFEEFGKHFLRDDQPEGPSEVWHARAVAGSASPAGGPRFGVSTELDQLALPYVQQFRSIVLRRGFAGSRPPADFRRIWQGHWYEIWQRSASGPRVLEHIVLGVPRAPAAAPRCRDLRGLARRASGLGARLALAPLDAPPLMAPGKSRHSPSWPVDGSDPFTLVPVGPGEVHGRLAVARPGRYDVWLEGSFGRGMTVFVDGRRIGEVSNALNARGDAEPVTTLTLPAGDHAVTLLRGGGNLAPGNGIDPRVGPLALTPAGEPHPLVTVAPRDAARWCGRSLDWMEIVA